MDSEMKNILANLDSKTTDTKANAEPMASLLTKFDNLTESAKSAKPVGGIKAQMKGDYTMGKGTGPKHPGNNFLVGGEEGEVPEEKDEQLDEVIVPMDDGHYKWTDDETGEVFKHHPDGPEQRQMDDNRADEFTRKLLQPVTNDLEQYVGDMAAGGGDPIDYLINVKGWEMDDLDSGAQVLGFGNAQDYVDSFSDMQMHEEAFTRSSEKTSLSDVLRSMEEAEEGRKSRLAAELQEKMDAEMHPEKTNDRDQYNLFDDILEGPDPTKTISVDKALRAVQKIAGSISLDQVGQGALPTLIDIIRSLQSVAGDTTGKERTGEKPDFDSTWKKSQATRSGT